MDATGKDRLIKLWNSTDIDRIYTAPLITKVEGIECTNTESHTLIYIDTHPGISSIELSEALGKTRGAVSQMLKRLFQKKLVNIIQDPNHGKRKLLYATEKGKLMCQKHKKIDYQRLNMTIKMLEAKYTPEQVDFALNVMSDILELQSQMNSNTKDNI